MTKVRYHGAEEICDSCCLQEYLEEEGLLVCKTQSGCVMIRDEGSGKEAFHFIDRCPEDG